MHAGPAKILRAAACLRPFTRRLSELLDEIEPAALVTNAVKAHVIGALARKPQQLPLIWYMRDGLEQRMLSRKLLALCCPGVAIWPFVFLSTCWRNFANTFLPRCRRM